MGFDVAHGRESLDVAAGSLPLSRAKHGRTSACQLAPEPLCQSHACLDLHSADRDGLDVDAERDTQAAAEGHQLKCGCLGMLEGCVEGVLGVAQVVFDPARDIDAEPSEELQ